jgi:hypothetical protein
MLNHAQYLIKEEASQKAKCSLARETVGAVVTRIPFTHLFSARILPQHVECQRNTNHNTSSGRL